MLKNKRYKDIFDFYIYKGEATPISIGALVVCAFCFLLLVVTTFTQINIYCPWASNSLKTISYSPIIPLMIFIIYLLGTGYCVFLFVLYLLTGLFIMPIFLFGGGIESFSNYIFGYFLGFLSAIIISGKILSISHTIKSRLLATFVGIALIHITGLIYCFLLAIFGVIDFSIISPVFQVLTLNRILYDIFFALIIILIAPYIKNVFWVCMKPRMDKKVRKND